MRTTDDKRGLPHRRPDDLEPLGAQWRQAPSDSGGPEKPSTGGPSGADRKGRVEGPGAAAGPGVPSPASERGTPQSVQAIADMLEITPGELLRRGVGQMLELARRGAMPGTRASSFEAEPVVRLQFSGVSNPRLLARWRQLEGLQVPASMAKQLVEAAQRPGQDPKVITFVLDGCTNILRWTADELAGAGVAARRDASRLMQERALECLASIGTPEFEDRWRVLNGLDELFWRFVNLADTDYWYGLFASPDFSSAMEWAGRCLSRDSSAVSIKAFEGLLGRLGNMARALPIARGTGLVEASFRLLHERTVQAEQAGERVSWSLDDTDACIGTAADRAYALIEREWLPQLGDPSTWSAPLMRALRNTLGECPHRRAREALSVLLSRKWFQELDQRDSKYAGAVAFCVGTMVHYAETRRVPVQMESTRNTVLSILDGSLPIAQHAYQGRSILGLCGEDGVSINQALYLDTRFRGLTPSLRMLVMETLPHERYHHESGAWKKGGVFALDDEYHAWMSGFVNREARVPTLREAAYRVAYILAGSETYTAIGEAWRLDPGPFERYLRALFQCDPAELQGLSYDELLDRAAEVPNDQLAPAWSWEGFHVGRPKPKA